ncbi:MAG: hypothetical protein R3C11_04005 [Planctomycetaceae bacterium]
MMEHENSSQEAVDQQEHSAGAIYAIRHQGRFALASSRVSREEWRILPVIRRNTFKLQKLGSSNKVDRLCLSHYHSHCRGRETVCGYKSLPQNLAEASL